VEHAEGSIVIEAPLEDVIEVIENYEAYPEWADVQMVEVRQRGQGGRATEVAFEVDVPVMGKAAYTLSYIYAAGDTGLSWTTKEARGANPRRPRRVPTDGASRRRHEGRLPPRGRTGRSRPRVPPNRGSEARHRERARTIETPRGDGLTHPPFVDLPTSARHGSGCASQMAGCRLEFHGGACGVSSRRSG